MEFSLPQGMKFILLLREAKSIIHEMYMTLSKEEALSIYAHFIKTYEDKYPKTVECLTIDKEDLFSF